MFNKLIRGGQADKELSVSRLPRLLLQLHALTDNPMSIIVTGNVTIGASLEASIPTTETYLVNINEDYTTVNETRTVHIPSGVKVLKVRVYSESGAGGDDFCTAYVQNADNKKVWVIAKNYGSCDETKYVGVTGGKDYKLNLYAGTEYDTMAALIRISYSQSINNTTPSVTDY